MLAAGNLSWNVKADRCVLNDLKDVLYMYCLYVRTST